MNKFRNIAHNIRYFSRENKIKVEFKNYISDKQYFKYDKESVIKYLKSQKICENEFAFSKSEYCNSLYASTYGCLLESLYKDISTNEKRRWKEYFDNHQRDDGLFYDEIYDMNDFLYGTEGWGATHLVPHIIIAYNKIGYKPKYEFRYLEKYKNPDEVIKWLDSLNFCNIWASSNAIMNYGVAMQYSRDEMNGQYSLAIEAMQDYLLNKVNEYGMWFEGSITSQLELNEMIRGAYHILPIMYYDSIEIPYASNAVDKILKSQNKWGGFDTYIASSACEDIDGLDPLIRYSIMAKREKEDIVKKAIDKARKWILFNQNDDGGFVFEKDTPFCYGGQKVLSSLAGESNMFATWFRCVSLELINDFECGKNKKMGNIPGYELKLWKRENR